MSNDGMNSQFVALVVPSFSVAQWPAVSTIDWFVSSVTP